MTDVIPEKLEHESLDIAADRIEKLREDFPEVFRDGKIDFDTLKRALGEYVEPENQRFGLQWPGKAAAFQAVQTPSVATLLPDPENSVDWDITQNLIIEGDNLEVLKLLQKSYYGKVKMIYIDPPYNTGNDFIYPDNYREGLQSYLEFTGQVNAEGKKLTTNTESGGRYHSNWLNMMYPRLYLARNLLRDDGLIFVSIDDTESMNLRQLMNEVFGEDNFVADINVVNNLKGRNDKKYIARANERLLMYVKSPEFIEQGLALPEGRVNEFTEKDENGAYRLLGLRKRGGPDTRAERPNMYYPIYVSPEDGTVSLQSSLIHSYEVLPRKSDGTDGRWRWGQQKVAENLSELVGRRVGSQGRFDVFEKDYLADEDGETRRIKPKSVFFGTDFSTDTATKQYRSLMRDADISNPKPVGMLQYLIEYATGSLDNEIVCDFFAGSGTTGHAVLAQNARDGGNRRYLLVQLPEPLDEPIVLNDGRAVTKIDDITRERMRRAGNDIAVDKPIVDIGFRSYRLATSSFTPWDGTPPNAKQGKLDLNLPDTARKIARQLEAFTENVVPNRTQEDLLTEIILRLGYDLTVPVEKVTISGHTVFAIDNGAILACLEPSLTLDLFEDMAQRDPGQIVGLDSAFGDDDELKVNAVQVIRSRARSEEATIKLWLV